MYALHEAGSAVSTAPPPAATGPPPGQVEPRAVESTEHSTLETEDRHDVVYTASSAVLDLVRDSAETYAEMVAAQEARDGRATPSGAYLGESVGERLDVRA
jgi:hypothetical protein